MCIYTAHTSFPFHQWWRETEEVEMGDPEATCRVYSSILGWEAEQIDWKWKGADLRLLRLLHLVY